MSYAELTTESPSLLKRFSHSKRFDIALELLEIEGNENILDYGTGDGFMLKKLLSENPRNIVGYEPIKSQYKQLEQFVRGLRAENVNIVSDLSCIEAYRFDKICCLEVLEHLTEVNQSFVLTSIKNLLKDDGGEVVVSVPIEVGLSGLLKNIARYFLRQTHPNSTILNVIKSFFGQRIDRGDADYIPSHIGFNHKDLEKIICSVGFEIERKHFSPFRELRGLINSQVFFVLKRKVE